MRPSRSPAESRNAPPTTSERCSTCGGWAVEAAMPGGYATGGAIRAGLGHVRAQLRARVVEESERAVVAQLLRGTEEGAHRGAVERRAEAHAAHSGGGELRHARPARRGDHVDRLRHRLADLAD